MSDDFQNTNPNERQSLTGDPDCLKCLRQKLRALCVVVFFRKQDSWVLDNFQGDKPAEAAEAEFQYMLKLGIPETALKLGKVAVLNGAKEIADTFPGVQSLFEGFSLITATVQRGESLGVRLAWREQEDPFTEEDSKTIECFGDCPKGCE